MSPTIYNVMPAKLLQCFCAFVLVSAAACSSSSTPTGTGLNSTGVNSDDPAATGPFDSIAGLWDFSRTPVSEDSIAYFEILTDGLFTPYAYNAQFQCYSTNSIFLESIGDDKYQFKGGETVLTITANSNQLTMVSPEGESVAPRISTVTPALVSCEGQQAVDYGFAGDEYWPYSLPGAKPLGINPFASSDVQWSTDTSRIAGTWDSSTRENGVVDEVYTIISTDGKMTDADYRDNQSGAVENCYDLTESRLEHDGNDRYRILDDGIISDEFNASVVNDLLSLTFSNRSYSWPRAMGVDPLLIQCR